MSLSIGKGVAAVAAERSGCVASGGSGGGSQHAVLPFAAHPHLRYCAALLPQPPQIASMLPPPPTPHLSAAHLQQHHPQLQYQHQHRHLHQLQHQPPPSQTGNAAASASASSASTALAAAAMALPLCTDSAYASHYASRYTSAMPSAAVSGSVSPVKAAPRQSHHYHQLQQQPLQQHQLQQLQLQQLQLQQQSSLKPQLQLATSDSCYASRAGSTLHSRAPSPTTCSSRTRLAVGGGSASIGTASVVASAAASAGQSRRASRAPSPTRAPATAAVSRVTPYAVVLPRGQTRLLDEASAVQLCRRSLQEELESAVRWLGALDWTSASAFEAASDEAGVMEDEFRGSYDCEPPTVASSCSAAASDTDTDSADAPSAEDAESHMILADTILSMVEAAWADEQESDDELCIAGRPMQVPQRPSKPKKEDAIYNVRYKTLPCLHWQKNRTCPAGDHCHFAHGPQELRQPQRHPKFKTQVCQNFKRTGRCLFGSRCFFKHAAD